MCPSPPSRDPRFLRFSVVCALLLAAGCAPHVPRVAELDPAARTDQYRVGVARRTVMARSVQARAMVWAQISSQRLPGAEATLVLGAPDAFRLRVGSLFGTALDLGVRGDSVRAYVPSRRQGLALDAMRDDLGLHQPGSLGVRALAALWNPPDAAWQEARWEGDLLVARWLEREDSLALAVGRGGLPLWASFTRPGEPPVRADYQAWTAGPAAPWPSQIRIEEARGALRLTCKLSQFEFGSGPHPDRLSVRIPSTAEQLTLAELRAMIARLGSLP